MHVKQHVNEFARLGSSPVPSITRHHAGALYHVEQAPLALRPDRAARNIASDPDRQHLLDRMDIRELCEGWPVYRDAAEWENYRSMFHPGAYITTSWEQGTIEQFIAASKAVFAE
ncbi:hypothetical protein PG988_011131 [Apiospora saccharicola]